MRTAGIAKSFRHAAAAASILILLTSWTAAARAADETAAVSIRPLPKNQWDRTCAEHLLRRAGFGGTPAEIDRLFTLGLEGAVDFLVDYQKISYEIAPPPVDPDLYEPPDRTLAALMTREEREQYMQKRRMLERQALEETRLWWIERILESPRPLEEKLTLFWHGHFTSGVREVKNAVFMKEQNEFLRRHAADSFRELLIGISKDRAMLVYLDNAKNNERQPNENYAREVMELFTLGVGNYTENDIKAAARALTGWTYDRQGFVFRRRDHDYNLKRFLGRTGNFDGEDVIDIILDQQQCSKHLAQKLLKFFVNPEPEKRLVEAFAADIRKNKYSIRESLRTLFKSRAFYDTSARACLVKSPVQLLVQAAREMRLASNNLRALDQALIAMGQELFQPPNVKGWDGGADWINTATLFNRYNFIGSMVNGVPPERLGGRFLKRLAEAAERRAAEAANDEEARPDSAMKGLPQARSRLAPAGAPRPYDPLPEIREQRLTSAADVVDYYAARLIAGALGDAKRAQLVSYLSEGSEDFDVASDDAAQRIRTLIYLMCSTPEYQLY
jgi:uncharacterized protein (DUF1800 family)